MFLLSMFVVVPALHLSCFSNAFIWESCTKIWLSLVHVHIWKGVLWWYGPMYMLCSSTCSCWVFLVMFLLLFYLLFLFFLFLFLFSPVFIQELRYESCTCWGLGKGASFSIVVMTSIWFVIFGKDYYVMLLLLLVVLLFLCSVHLRVEICLNLLCFFSLLLERGMLDLVLLCWKVVFLLLFFLFVLI